MDDDGDDKDDTKRRTRNLSEKKRRDHFNMLVNELSSMVSSNNRKMDKSTVLKSAISYLKNHNEITVRSRAYDVQEDWKPAFLCNEEFTYLVLEALEGFIMVFSSSGNILYVSESITTLLGHYTSDLINKKVFDFISTEDRPKLYNLLQSHTSVTEPLQTQANENDIRFECYFRRGTLDFRDDPKYELVQFSGNFKTHTEHVESENISAYQPDRESRLLLVCTGRLYTPQLIRDVSLVDSSRSEFTSRHSLEWKFLFLDHRAPPIIGYLPFEVLGTSGYDYYHFDDLEKVVTCHEALMQKGELTSCYYRFLTKGQQWIWLQSRFYITYHQWNSKPEFVVCTHRVVSFADILKGTKQEPRDVPACETDPTCGSDTNRVVVTKTPPVDQAAAALSPSYMSESNGALAKQYHQNKPSSVKSASTSVADGGGGMDAVWQNTYQPRYAPSSDTASVSGDSQCSQRTSQQEMKVKAQRMVESEPCEAMALCSQSKPPEECLVPQHGIGAQYLEPSPYVGLAMPGVLPIQLPLPTLPVIVSSDQAQVQDQLQRKHEQLQQMIVRQQEELRQVKEQLLLARFGMLQPIINNPNQYVQEEMQQGQRLPAQIVYDVPTPAPGSRAAGSGYPAPLPSHSAHHSHMPQ